MPLFFDRFYLYITQMLRMTISWTSSSLSVLEPRSMSQWLFLDKNIVIALAPSFMDLFWFNFPQMWGMTISWIFLFWAFYGQGQGHRCYFRKKIIVIALAPSFVDRFCCNFTQMFSGIILWSNSSFSCLELRSMSGLCSNRFWHGNTAISYPQCSLTFIRERY